MNATALTERGAAPWSLAEERLRNPERPRTYWLATVGSNGAPHVMPLIAVWLDDALYFLSGNDTQKGRNLAHEPRCVVATGSTTLPSLDLILEGEAERITDEPTLRSVVEAYGTQLEWPLEVTDGGVTGPNAPTAGPPPYAISGSSQRVASGCLACSAWSSSIQTSCRVQLGGMSIGPSDGWRGVDGRDLGLWRQTAAGRFRSSSSSRS